MLLLRRTITVILLAGLFAGTLSAEGFKLPPFSGELSGKFKANAVVGAPEVAWTVKIVPSKDDLRHLIVDLVADGSRLTLRAKVAETTGDGTWEISESELDAGAWLTLLSPQLGALSADVAATGKIRLIGRGTIKRGIPSGIAEIVWSDGSLKNAVAGWTLDGITFKGDLAINPSDLAAMNSENPWELTIQTISSARFGARNLAVTAKFNDNRTVSLLSARVEIAGGQMEVDPSTVSLFPPVLDFNVRVQRVGLQDLFALVPGSVSDTRGRIDGMVRLGWSKLSGLQIGEGQFNLRDDEVAILRLVPAPGFLTQRVPERLALLPGWMGPLGRWLATPNPVYGDVEEIEMGRRELQIVSFGLLLTPKGDDRERSGTLQIIARPTTAGGVVKLVKFDLNIFGSVSDLLKWSMTEQAAFEVK